MGAFSSKSLVNVTPINDGFLAGYYHIGFEFDNAIEFESVLFGFLVDAAKSKQTDPTKLSALNGTEKYHHTYITEPTLISGDIITFAVVPRYPNPVFKKYFVDQFLSHRQGLSGNDINKEFEPNPLALTIRGTDMMIFTIKITAITKNGATVDNIKGLLEHTCASTARLSWVKATHNDLFDEIPVAEMAHKLAGVSPPPPIDYKTMFGISAVASASGYIRDDLPLVALSAEIPTWFQKLITDARNNFMNTHFPTEAMLLMNSSSSSLKYSLSKKDPPILAAGSSSGGGVNIKVPLKTINDTLNIINKWITSTYTHWYTLQWLDIEKIVTSEIKKLPPQQLADLTGTNNPADQEKFINEKLLFSNSSARTTFVPTNFIFKTIASFSAAIDPKMIKDYITNPINLCETHYKRFFDPPISLRSPQLCRYAQVEEIERILNVFQTAVSSKVINPKYQSIVEHINKFWPLVIANMVTLMAHRLEVHYLLATNRPPPVPPTPPKLPSQTELDAMDLPLDASMQLFNKDASLATGISTAANLVESTSARLLLLDTTTTTAGLPNFVAMASKLAALDTTTTDLGDDSIPCVSTELETFVNNKANFLVQQHITMVEAFYTNNIAIKDINDFINTQYKTSSAGYNAIQTYITDINKIRANLPPPIVSITTKPTREEICKLLYSNSPTVPTAENYTKATRIGIPTSKNPPPAALAAIVTVPSAPGITPADLMNELQALAQTQKLADKILQKVDAQATSDVNDIVKKHTIIRRHWIELFVAMWQEALSKCITPTINALMQLKTDLPPAYKDNTGKVLDTTSSDYTSFLTYTVDNRPDPKSITASALETTDANFGDPTNKKVFDLDYFLQWYDQTKGDIIAIYQVAANNYNQAKLLFETIVGPISDTVIVA